MTEEPRKTWIRLGSSNEAILAVGWCEVKKDDDTLYEAINGNVWEKLGECRAGGL